MLRIKNVFPIFLLFIVLSLIVVFFLQSLLTKPLQQITLPIQKIIFGKSFSISSDTTSTAQLREENNKLRLALAKTKELERDNHALHDQFQNTKLASHNLLPAEVIGMSNDKIVIDKGTDQKIKIGQIVVVDDNLIGSISKTTPKMSIVILISNISTSFTAKTVNTNALGVIRSVGGENNVYLDNVVLSDKLEKNDLVSTKGDVDENGIGFPPNLIIGKIVSVNNKASSLFQQAKIESLVDFDKLRMVFVKVE